MAPDNANPTIYARQEHSKSRRTAELFGEIDDWDSEQTSGTEDDIEEPIDADEVFGKFLPWHGDLIRSINDPEHPLTLEQLAVVSAEQIKVTHGKRPHVEVEFTPTVPHCGMATLIGLALRVRLLRALPDRFKVDIHIKEGSHQSENAVNKQLNDKERVAAALENNHLLDVVHQCIATAGQRGKLATAA